MPVKDGQSQDTTSGGNKSRLSKDGKWRSFPRVPNLLQYRSSGTYFARLKVEGKIFRQSLETDVWTTAKLRLVDFLKKHQEPTVDPAPYPSFEAAANAFILSIGQDTGMKETSKHYRMTCIRKIQLSWPNLWKRRIDEITPDECSEWAARLKEAIASQYFNNTLDTLRLILDHANQRLANPDARIENPTRGITRAKIRSKELKLPEPDQFRQLVAYVEKLHSWGKAAAELIEFLAYSGTRLYTEAQWVNWEDIDWNRREIIVRGDPTTGTKNGEIRRVPLLPNMAGLLERLRADQAEPLTGKILRITECPGTLKKACLAIGIPPLRHHDLRHLFATRCIESGVDIPTVARWLGHSDGGALAMRVYGHLRNEHSQQMAQKVKF